MKAEVLTINVSPMSPRANKTDGAVEKDVKSIQRAAGWVGWRGAKNTLMDARQRLSTRSASSTCDYGVQRHY